MKIQKLPDDVIARISAGEVVTSPSTVVKELIENALDANSSFVQLEITKDFQNITIIDNGSGIDFRDIKNVCAKNFTSKYAGSLFNLQTFGFRGEALASMSQTSFVRVESRCLDSDYGFVANYSNYEVIDHKFVSCNFGTKIVVSELFYNNDVRREYFMKNRGEVGVVISILMSFLVHFCDKHFVLYVDDKLVLSHKPRSDLACVDLRNSTVNGSKWAVEPKDNFEVAFKTSLLNDSDQTNNENLDHNSRVERLKTPNIMKERVEIEIFEDHKRNEPEDIANDDEIDRFDPKTDTNSSKAKLEYRKHLIDEHYKTYSHLIEYLADSFYFIISSASFTSSKPVFILFVNDRLVHNTYFRDLVLNIYKDVLPKHKYPFVYVSVNVDLENVDVNVHPSKKEVLFVDEQNIFKKIANCIKTQLDSFHTINSTKIGRIPDRTFEMSSQIVYTDPNTSSLDPYLQQKVSLIKPDVQRVFSFKSISELKKELVVVDHEFCKSLVFVGTNDNQLFVQSFSFLKVADLRKFMFNCYYQYILARFGNFDSMVCRFECDLDVKKCKILNAYFGFEITDSVVTKVPVVFDVSLCKGAFKFFAEMKSMVLSDEKTSFKEIICILSNNFVDSTEMNAVLFNKMKKVVLGTKDVLDCFQILTSLNELYKLFERC